MLFRSERGAQTSVYLASSDAVQGVTGAYWNDKRIAKTSASAQDTDAQERLWLESAKIAGLT